MSATIEAGAQRQETGTDIEKSQPYDAGVQELHQTKSESDAESENFQNGVQRVRAMTTVMSRKTVISMFAL